MAEIIERPPPVRISGKAAPLHCGLFSTAIEAAMEDGEKNLFHIIWCNLAHVNNKTGNHKDSEKFARLAIQSKPEWYKVKTVCNCVFTFEISGITAREYARGMT